MILRGKNDIKRHKKWEKTIKIRQKCDKKHAKNKNRIREHDQGIDVDRTLEAFQHSDLEAHDLLLARLALELNGNALAGRAVLGDKDLA